MCIRDSVRVSEKAPRRGASTPRSVELFRCSPEQRNIKPTTIGRRCSRATLRGRVDAASASPPSDSPWRSTGAVSYTHLDVYKRQTVGEPVNSHSPSLDSVAPPLAFAASRATSKRLRKARSSDEPASNPVSYTHLRARRLPWFQT